MTGPDIITLLMLLLTIGIIVYVYKINKSSPSESITKPQKSKINMIDVDKILKKTKIILPDKIKLPTRIPQPFDYYAESNNNRFGFRFPTKDDNMDREDTDSWTRMFNPSLVDNVEKEAYFEKLRKKHMKYGENMDDFAKYQMDNDTILRTDISIDMFKDNTDQFKNRKISEIYDSLTKPKFIKRSEIY